MRRDSLRTHMSLLGDTLHPYATFDKVEEQLVQLQEILHGEIIMKENVVIEIGRHVFPIIPRNPSADHHYSN